MVPTQQSEGPFENSSQFTDLASPVLNVLHRHHPLAIFLKVKEPKSLPASGSPAPGRLPYLSALVFSCRPSPGVMNSLLPVHQTAEEPGMPGLGPLHQDVCPLPGYSSLISLNCILMPGPPIPLPCSDFSFYPM